MVEQNKRFPWSIKGVQMIVLVRHNKRITICKVFVFVVVLIKVMH